MNARHCFIVTNCFNHEEAFDFLCKAHPGIFLRILDDSLSVPDCDLVRALSLERMDELYTVSVHGILPRWDSPLFTFAPFLFLQITLGKLLGTWDVQGYNDPEMDAWRRRLGSLDVVWIRYIGQCKHPALPWERHVCDMGERTTGFFCRFFRDLEAMGLEAMGYEAKKHVNIYQMVSANCPLVFLSTSLMTGSGFLSTCSTI